MYAVTGVFLCPTGSFRPFFEQESEDDRVVRNDGSIDHKSCSKLLSFRVQDLGFRVRSILMRGGETGRIWLLRVRSGRAEYI